MARRSAASQRISAQPLVANMQELMIQRLPAPHYIVLETAGRLADELGLSVFVVGGIVRDLFLEAGAFDLDLVVEGDGVAFARALAREMGGQLTAHARFGTATVTLPEGLKIDIATARKESYEQPAALPVVVPAMIQDDLLRRDFTINALAVRINIPRFGEVLDTCIGQGDVSAKRIRVLHDRSFLDDPTRIFRAIRFEQRLGFRMDRTTLALARAAVKKHIVAHLSGRRLCDELRLMLSEAHPRHAIARMGELGILRAIHPKLRWSKKIGAMLAAVEKTLGRYTRSLPHQQLNTWLLYMMVLVDGLSPKVMADVLNRLTMPEQEAEPIRAGHVAAAPVLRFLTKRRAPRPSDTYRALEGLSNEAVVFIMAKAKTPSARRQLFTYLTTSQHITLTLTGTDLKAFGLKPGPLFKKIFDRLLDARLNGEVKTDAEERTLAKEMIRKELLPGVQLGLSWR